MRFTDKNFKKIYCQDQTAQEMALFAVQAAY